MPKQDRVDLLSHLRESGVVSEVMRMRKQISDLQRAPVRIDVTQPSTIPTPQRHPTIVRATPPSFILPDPVVFQLMFPPRNTRNLTPDGSGGGTSMVLTFPDPTLVFGGGPPGGAGTIYILAADGKYWNHDGAIGTPWHDNGSISGISGQTRPVHAFPNTYFLHDTGYHNITPVNIKPSGSDGNDYTAPSGSGIFIADFIIPLVLVQDGANTKVYSFDSGGPTWTLLHTLTSATALSLTAFDDLSGNHVIGVTYIAGGNLKYAYSQDADPDVGVTWVDGIAIDSSVAFGAGFKLWHGTGVDGVFASYFKSDGAHISTSDGLGGAWSDAAFSADATALQDFIADLSTGVMVAYFQGDADPFQVSTDGGATWTAKSSPKASSADIAGIQSGQSDIYGVYIQFKDGDTYRVSDPDAWDITFVAHTTANLSTTPEALLFGIQATPD